MQKIWLIFLSVWMVAWGVQAQESAPPSSSAPSVEALQKELKAKEEQLRDLDRTYQALLEKARATQDHGERRRIMEEALRVSYRIQKLYAEYEKLFNEVRQKSQPTEKPDPQAEKLLAQIRELEATIHRMVEDINARIQKAEKETDPVLQERAKKQIQRMMEELDVLKKRHQELAEQYRRLVEKAAESPKKEPPQEQKPPSFR